MADLAVKLESAQNGGGSAALVALFLIAFGIKAAVFPLFSWLPASYPHPPAAVTALFSGLLTKVGVYAIFRLFTLVFVGWMGSFRWILLLLAAATMVTGVLGALAQSELRRLLSFHIVSQIGYPLMGLALFTRSALAGAIFFLVHVVLAKAALILVGGVTERIAGTDALARLGGFAQKEPTLAGLFLVPALALAGLPPLSGFFGKLALIRAGLAERQFAIVAVALGVSVLTLFSMVKIWTKAFWAPSSPGDRRVLSKRDRATLLLPIGSLAALTVLLGLWAGSGLALANDAAGQLLERSHYVREVLK
jgi:multicomponent Na+:H+ antiporter subunit D